MKRIETASAENSMNVTLTADQALLFLDGNLDLVGFDANARLVFGCGDEGLSALSACLEHLDPNLRADLRDGRFRTALRIDGRTMERRISSLYGSMPARYAVQYRPSVPAPEPAVADRRAGQQGDLAGPLECFPEAVAHFDEDDRLVACSRAFAAYLSVQDMGDLRGQSRADLCARAASLGYRELDATARLRLVGGAGAAALMATPDGGALRQLAIPLPSGGVMLLLTDVTALAQEAGRVTRVLEGSRVAAWSIDLTTGDLVLDGDWEGLLGYSKEELARFTLDDFAAIVHPEDVVATVAAREAAARGTQPRFDLEQRVRHKSGHYVWINFRGSVLEHGVTGRPRLLSGVKIDITERKAIERDLQERVHALSEIQDGIAITSADGFYTYMNAAHRRMFGLGLEEDLSELHWSGIYTPEVASMIESEVMPALLRDGVWRGPLIGRHRTGRAIPQEVSLTLMDHGNLICATRDISEQLENRKSRALLREKLLLSQRHEIVHILLEGVAHDLNNLLGSIRHTAELIADGYSDHPAEDAERILRAAEAGALLVSARLHLATRTRHVRPADIGEALQEPIQLARDTLPFGVTLSVTAPDEPVILECDPIDITQVALNLLLNARDALEGETGRIDVTLDRVSPDDLEGLVPAIGSIQPSRPYAAIRIADSGRGMDASQQAHLFDFGYSTKAREGRGLGMVVVSEIVGAI
ncbi:MAG: PAS domain-containing protein, partial [Paracoccaceae bacterium]